MRNFIIPVLIIIFSFYLKADDILKRIDFSSKQTNKVKAKTPFFKTFSQENIKIDDKNFSDIKKRICKKIESYFAETGLKIKISFPSFNAIPDDSIIEFSNLHGGRNNIRLIAKNRIYYLPCDIEFKQGIASLNRSVSYGDKLSSEDIVYRDIYIKDPENYFTEDLNWDNYYSKKNLCAGSLIKKYDIAKKNIVKYGDIVDLIYRSGSISIKVQCRALGDGAVGDNLLFENIASGKKLHAVLKSKNLAEYSVD